MAQMIMPLMGGSPRAFLDRGATSPSWSPDDRRMAYFKNEDGDPMFVADRLGGDARQILAEKGVHHHNPIWSRDGRWIYFAGGPEPTESMDVWRVPASGGMAERLTQHGTAVNFLAPLDIRTILYVGRDEDRSGPWLWLLDTERKQTRRIGTGVGQYTSVSASRDGRRVVATVANPTATLWQVPLTGGESVEHDVRPYVLPTARSLAPRFGGSTLFFLSSVGAGDGLWRMQDGRASVVSKSGEGGLFEPPAVAPDGRRAVVVVRREGKRHLLLVTADGRSSRTLASSIEVEGAAGQGMADWSPDGRSLVVSGRDSQGSGLFRVEVDADTSTRLVSGRAANPIWSPKGDVIVYAGRFFTGQVELLAVRPDGSPANVPTVRARPGGYRFLPDGSGLIYLPFIPSLDFWRVDFASHTERQVTRLENHGALGTFDLTADGKTIVFDRSKENSDNVLIDLPR
jgi:Tol biopolymer transport system component